SRSIAGHRANQPEPARTSPNRPDRTPNRPNHRSLPPMIRSMISAISGLRNHQTMMDVVGNNISNVNTTGFKSSTTVFQDVLSQVVRGAGAADAELGGTNPAQVGLGSRIAAITTNFGQGALQRSGRASDLAIPGAGFFVFEQAGQLLFTRAVSFSLDALCRLVTLVGAFIQGW